jgi:hypothetical protein
MTTLLGNSVSDNTSMQHFAGWAQFYNKAFAACGWKQLNDTGQVEWPATIVSIASVAVGGGNATYTYDATSMTGPALVIGQPISVVGFVTNPTNNIPLTQGIITALGGSGATSTFTVLSTGQIAETHAATGGTGRAFSVSQVSPGAGIATYTYNAAALTGGPLRVGQSVNVVGFVTAGNNITGTQYITALGGSGASSTFTVALSTQVLEVHAAVAVVNPNLYMAGSGSAPLVPNTVGVYEIWQSTDALSSTCPITVRMDYGNGGSTSPKVWIEFGTGGSNGSGTLSAPASGLGNHQIGVFGNDSGLRNNYACGDAGNIRIGVNWGAGNSNYFQFVCLSRSYDGTGNPTGQYAMLFVGSWNFVSQQAIFPPSGGGGIAPAELQSWIALCGQTTSQSQGFGGNVAVSPVYCVVGGFSNPTPDLCVGKTVDFTDGTQVTVSFYNVNHNYVVSNAGKAFNNSSAGALLMRFE